MKKFRKLLSLVLAMVMVLAMAAPSFADEPEPETGTITINNALEGQTYTLYKIFDLESYTSTGQYSYKVVAEWKPFITQWSQFFTLEGDYLIENKMTDNSTDAETFAKAALTYAENHETISDVGTYSSDSENAVKNDEGETYTITISGLTLGYYLLDSTTGTLCSLNTTNPTVDINEKNAAPEIKKERVNVPEGEDTESVSVGDTVNYKVTITAQPGAENYVMKDTMSPGLSFNDDVVIAGLVSGRDYTVEQPGDNDTFTFKIVFTDTYCANIATETDIVITYSATVNESAIEGTDPITNSAILDYGDENHITNTPVTTVTLYTYAFGVVKTDTTNKVLNGAKFKLYGSATGADEIKVVSIGTDVESGTQKYRKATDAEIAAETNIVEIEAGIAIIDGLKAGTYYLEETDAPEGYNRLVNRKDVTITDSDNIGTVNNNMYVKDSGGVQVINKTGTILPSTGGIGTTIFYAAGIILMAGAVFFVVRRKRA